MKFDRIIMNPPFARNLHLKILQQAINYLRDDNSKLVNLSPDSHFHNVAVYYAWNKECGICENTIAKCKNVEFVSHEDANELFGLGNGIDSLHIGIYVKNNVNVCNVDNIKNLNAYNLIYPKIENANIKNLRNMFVRKEQLGEFGLRMYRYHAGKTVYDSIVCDTEKGRAAEGINFSSALELDNFKKSLNTFIYKFMFNVNDVNPAHLPYMGNSLNPRTGKIGYESEWTDADLYKYFELTDEEIKTIEDDLTKYNTK